MANEKAPITIKKYANRRLYNTGTSTYVTLEDLAVMVKKGEDFVVFDAKTGDEITRSVLTQIIFEQEAKDGQSLLPIAFLRQLIRFYGDSMQMLVPSYLEYSIGNLTSEQQKFREQIQSAIGGKALPGGQIFGALEEQARKNMAMFSQALGMFNPFVPNPSAGAAPGGLSGGPAGGPAGKPGKAEAASAAGPSTDIETLKKQLHDMQSQIESLSRKG
ncbi:MAG: polyhydroxyalkanoate synthesis repressor PhaR [Beijerinckiaceae bacterium]|nr:polyhydroxyalkanoate synthesis repressor PhaR [Beijerinckiaceae bacterium]MDO9442928.1 polyhydroxyalkanoate synthesis repressor PhaR [Beijerinckiaceae bacterium]